MKDLAKFWDITAEQLSGILDLLEQFIEKAEECGYASGIHPLSLEDGSEQLLWENDVLHYTDNWFGHVRSFGRIAVRIKPFPAMSTKDIFKLPIFWVHQYGGGMIPSGWRNIYDIEFRKRIFSVLKQALSAPSEGFRPRGPAIIAENMNFGCRTTYRAETVGDIRSFKVNELIKDCRPLERTVVDPGVDVFEHFVHGGLVIGSERPINLDILLNYLE
jgi:hypothetical protein